MTQGVPTSEKQKLAFAEAYMRLRIASVAAREVGLEERTGRNLAKELEGDPTFSAAFRSHRERVMEKATDACISMMDLAVERAHRFEPVLLDAGGYSDVGSSYAKTVADIGRTVEKLDRQRREVEGTLQGATSVQIQILGPGDDGEDDEEEPAPGKPIPQ